jgi:hypothetical protein
MLALLGLSLGATASEEKGVQADVKYIRCSTCQAFVTALHAAAHKAAADKKAPPSEEECQQIIERVCVPTNPEGEWMTRADLVEHQQDGTLELVQQPTEGPCGQECKTVGLACRTVVSEVENELVEALYADVASRSRGSKKAEGGSASASALPDPTRLRDATCKSICRKPAPKLDPSRALGPAFRPYTEEELAEREADRPPAPGVLTSSNLRVRLGVSTPADAARAQTAARSATADGAGASGLFGGLGGMDFADQLAGLGGGRGGGPIHGPAADDEATAAGGEALGRGESSAALEESAAFEELL